MTGASSGAGPVLLADIGGTNARFAVLSAGTIEARGDFAVAEHPGPEAAIGAYLQSLDQEQRPERALLAVAGPVAEGRAVLTNAAWRFDAQTLTEALGCPVRLANDFEAQAWAAAASRPQDCPPDFQQIGGHDPVPGAPLAIIGPGTGLGMAGFVRDGGGSQDRVLGMAIVGEGGHMTLAPRNDAQAELLARLRGRCGHVSAERVVSGPGLVLLASVLQSSGRAVPTSAEAVVAAARKGDEDARLALETFFDFLGVAAGNLALALGARGGVFLTGGILPRLEEELAASRFREAFEAKGRMRDYMAAIPCYLMRLRDPAFTGLRAMAEAWSRTSPAG
ncbi:MAG: glucokinase [Rhodovibrionaceae bacterium]|nr:glucokinase [Rhodovibrionaceae bacterium]